LIISLLRRYQLLLNPCGAEFVEKTKEMSMFTPEHNRHCRVAVVWFENAERTVRQRRMPGMQCGMKTDPVEKEKIRV
jgi:hypothetical protein